MKKENFKKLIEVYDSLVSVNDSYMHDIDLSQEIADMKEIMLEVAEDGLDGGPRFKSDKEVQDFVASLTKASIAFEEPLPAEHSELIAWSQKNYDIYDVEHMSAWPTWNDGRLVRVGEKAISLRGPLEITGIEMTANGWNLWGYSDGTRYIIDQGNEEQHPTREGEECDFWSPEDD